MWTVGGAVGLTAEAYSPRGLWAGWWTAGPGETDGLTLAMAGFNSTTKWFEKATGLH